jgi:hypothetical protein
MSPDIFQHLVDQLDQRLTGAETPAQASAETNETAEESKVLAFAVEAIRFEALNREVGHALAIARAEKAPVVSMTKRVALVSMRVAAGVAILLCVGGAAKFMMTSSSSVYDKNYAPYEMGTTRGAEDLTPLEQAYQSKSWASVDHIFATENAPSAKDQFLAGMAFMEQGQYTQAINQFKNVQRLKGAYQDESEYYLALAYLADHQPAPALIMLDNIKNDPEHLFHRRVMQMNAWDLLILRAK